MRYTYERADALRHANARKLALCHYKSPKAASAIYEPAQFKQRACDYFFQRNFLTVVSEAPHAERAEGTLYLSTDEHRHLHSMRNALHDHPLIRPIIEADGVAGETLIVNGLRAFPLFPCAARIDWHIDNSVIFELVPTQSITDIAAEFERDHYAFTGVFNACIYEQEYGKFPDIYYIAIERVPPYDAALISLTPETRERAYSDIKQAIELYERCTTHAQWPGTSWNWRAQKYEEILL